MEWHRRNFSQTVDANKTRMIGLRHGEETEICYRFQTIPARNGQTDRRMDRQNCYIISRVSVCWRAIKTVTNVVVVVRRDLVRVWRRSQWLRLRSCHCLSNAMRGQNINLPVCVSVCKGVCVGGGDIKTTINKLGTCRCKVKFCQPGFEAFNWWWLDNVCW